MSRDTLYYISRELNEGLNHGSPERKFIEPFLNDDQNEFNVEVKFSYEYHLGEIVSFWCQVKPLGTYHMTEESFKESVYYLIKDEIGYNAEFEEIEIIYS